MKKTRNKGELNAIVKTNTIKKDAQFIVLELTDPNKIVQRYESGQELNIAFDPITTLNKY